MTAEDGQAIPHITRPSPQEHLMAGDLPELPNGMATVARVKHPDGDVVKRARIEEHGALVSVEMDQHFVPRDWEVVGVGWYDDE
ncbi:MULTISPECIES: hypothetical protein [Halobacterium]|uniref:hypothetical protein n=1 Tax=Halobacterium TaxID=2239 RepID=UPI00073F6869|nr:MULTISPECIES: hypothetical protein [Halobacterium]MCG1002843.1 hypothetical protein [Halobacterium noricense]